MSGHHCIVLTLTQNYHMYLSYVMHMYLTSTIKLCIARNGILAQLAAGFITILLVSLEFVN
jgi:hypothetical protein